jgi:SNF2 family DNA or RNA helicase
VKIQAKSQGFLHLSCDKEDNWRIEPLAKELARGSGGNDWIIPILPNVEILRENFRRSEFTDEAIKSIKHELQGLSTTEFPGTWLGDPMDHQREALRLSHNKIRYFFAHATGTGKTFTLLNLAVYLHRSQFMQGLLVVCPASIIHDVWAEQVRQWLGERVEYLMLPLTKGHNRGADKFLATPCTGLKILIVSIEGLSNAKHKAFEVAEKFLRTNKCGMVVDESSRIKNHQRNRTKNTILLGAYAHWRWCMSGTKITQGLHDLWAQYCFLSTDIIGHRSFYTFRNRFVKMGGFENRQIVGYENVNELLRLIAPYTHEVRKEDANDLPQKIYQKRHVEPTKEQRDLYRGLTEEFETAYEGQPLEVATYLELCTRQQQIAGGNFPYEINEERFTRPIKGNPKLLELMDILDETDEKCIIWARFVPEIRQIVEAIENVYGKDAVGAYYGEVSTTDRTKNIARLRNNPNCRFLVANAQTAGMGLTLNEATTSIYYSNSFSYEDRYQSEDRNHRTGQTCHVTYIDIIANFTVERKIQMAIATKQNMAKFVSNELAQGLDTDSAL